MAEGRAGLVMFVECRRGKQEVWWLGLLIVLSSVVWPEGRPDRAEVAQLGSGSPDMLPPKGSTEVKPGRVVKI